jgi:hypothetical protein
MHIRRWGAPFVIVGLVACGGGSSDRASSQTASSAAVQTPSTFNNVGSGDFDPLTLPDLSSFGYLPVDIDAAARAGVASGFGLDPSGDDFQVGAYSTPSGAQLQLSILRLGGVPDSAASEYVEGAKEPFDNEETFAVDGVPGAAGIAGTVTSAPQMQIVFSARGTRLYILAYAGNVDRVEATSVAKATYQQIG